MRNDMSPYKAVITREQFLFFEMRATARLMMEGLSDEEIVQKIVNENLYQFPTEKMTKRMAGTCLHRLHVLDDDTLVQAIATMPQDV